MTDTATTATAKEGAAESAPSIAGRRITRETLMMLVLPPALVLLVFAGYVWWRQTADLDATVLRQLRWSTVLTLIGEHAFLTVVSSTLVVLIAVPLGILLTRGQLRRLAPIVIGVANFGQAAPSVGLIVLLYLWLSTSAFWSGPRIAILALTLYGLLPVLRNTIAGLQAVDPTLVEAGKGIGMSSGAVLFRIELPLAIPVIMAGVRTALVLVVGTATLATFINGGGLGDILQTGISLFRFELMVAGAVLVALLALIIEWLGRLLEFVTRPKGL